MNLARAVSEGAGITIIMLTYLLSQSSIDLLYISTLVLLEIMHLNFDSS